LGKRWPLLRGGAGLKIRFFSTRADSRLMAPLSDSECLVILRAEPRDREGAERAFALLFERYDRRLQCHLHCRYPSLRDEDLREICQETWLKVWRYLDAKVRAEAFRAWLYRIGGNQAIDTIRRKGRRPESALGERDVESARAGHVHELAFAEQMKRCVDRLPERLRDLMKRLLNLETFDEIAAATDLPKSRIYQIKHEIGSLVASCMEQGS
jgi:RNA polymerase sigma-70 factor (ECF subfamily)